MGDHPATASALIMGSSRVTGNSNLVMGNNSHSNQAMVSNRGMASNPTTISPQATDNSSRTMASSNPVMDSSGDRAMAGSNRDRGRPTGATRSLTRGVETSRLLDGKHHACWGVICFRSECLASLSNYAILRGAIA